MDKQTVLLIVFTAVNAAVYIFQARYIKMFEGIKQLFKDTTDLKLEKQELEFKNALLKAQPKIRAIIGKANELNAKHTELLLYAIVDIWVSEPPANREIFIRENFKENQFELLKMLKQFEADTEFSDTLPKLW